ncbi:hypothetical protein B9T16_30405, partial [Arthrospira sp. PCC 8006]
SVTLEAEAPGQTAIAARTPPAQSGQPAGSARIYSGGRWHDAPVWQMSELGSGQSVDGPALIMEPGQTVTL